MQNNHFIVSQISAFTLFAEFNKLELQNLAEACVMKKIAAGQDIILEGEQSSSIYLIMKGDVDVLKFDSAKESVFLIAKMTEGNYFGEMSFFDDSPRSCTIHTKTDCQLIKISKTMLTTFPEGQNLIDKIKFNIGNQSILLNRIRDADFAIVATLQKEKELLQQRKDFGNFFILTVMQLSAVVLIERYILENSITEHTLQFTAIFSWTYLVILALPTLIFIYFSSKKITEFGLNGLNLKKTFITTSIILAIILLFYLIKPFHLFKLSSLKIVFFNVPFLMYACHAFIQEFIVRGVLQTSLYNFLGYKNPLLAIFISSFLFGTIHIHFGVIPVLIAFGVGIPFGYLFYRQKNIFGISIIHAVLGWIGFQISLI